jgi:acetolactate synthase-1/2/3 large subunit
MGIAVPGAIAAKMVYPDRSVVAVTGDAGFLMNSQEIETAVRLQVPIVILIWNDGGYGLIEWKQLNQFKRASHVDFGNPDFVKYAEAFGGKGYRIDGPGQLQDVLKDAVAQPTVTIIDCPVDYSENLKLTEQLGNLVSPL